jgi:hypothetical protein
MRRAMEQVMGRTYFFAAALAVVVLCAGCSGQGPKVAERLNQEASLRGALPENPLAWKVITSEIDQKNATMSTLYGNDIAVRYARGNAGPNYPEGSKLALVTWTQREDEHWFGAKIPSQAQSVEFVFVQGGGKNHPAYSCERYSGTPLVKESAPQDSTSNERAAHLLSQRAAVMP